MPSRGQQLGKLLNTSGDIVETSLPPKIETFSQSVSNTGKIEAAALGDDVSTIEQVSDTNSLSASGNTVGDQRLVGSNLYIWNGTGWYRIALINTTPTWDSGGQPAASYALDADSPQDATVITLAASDPEGLPISYSYVTSGSMDSMSTISQDSSVFTITPKTVTEVGEGVTLTGSITFRASDGINILPSVSSFTLIFITTIQNSKYTTLLATATDTGDNNDITDSSTNNHAIAVNGDAHAGTFSPYRHGGYSTYFDGSGDYLSVPDDASLDLGTGDFTLEAWVRMDSTSGNRIIFERYTSGNNGSFQLYYRDTGNSIAFWTVADGVIAQDPSSSTIKVGFWHHIVATRESGTLKLYVDGSQVASASCTTNFDSTLSLTVGAQVSTGTNYFGGYISDCRIVNGTALYTSAFTPPTERLTDVSGTGYSTSLLTCHLPYIADGSSNGHTITINGNTSTKPFSPYDNLEYSVVDYGGSVYFDGTGDYLTAGSQANWKFLNDGSTDYTVEAWFYPTSTASRMEIISTNTNTVNNGYGVTFITSLSGDGAIIYQIANGVDGQSFKITTDPNVVTANTWNHVAVTLNVSGQELKVYVNGKLVKTETRWGINGLYYATTFNYGNANPNFTLNIGRWVGTVSGNGGYVNGNIQDLRITKSRVYTTDFTPPTAPLSTITNTDFLLNGTDASIIDKSQNANLKLVGNTTGSTTQVKFADTKSMYFDGTGDYITSSVVSFGNSFTAEAWIYQPVTAGTGASADDVFSVWNNSNGQKSFILRIDGTSLMLYASYDGTTNNISALSGGTINTNTWHHIALTWDGSNYRLFVDGTVVQTQASSTAPYSSNDPLQIGSSKSGASGAQDGFYQGYIQDARFTSGLARYTANFTPPTEPLKG